jgi:hypothetical protein
MSLKSILVNDVRVVTVKLLLVPTAADDNCILWVGDVPEAVSVVIVCAPANSNVTIPLDAGGVTEIATKLFTPCIECELVAVEVKFTVPCENDPPLKVVLADKQFTVADVTLKVKLVPVVVQGELLLSVRVEVPRVTLRTVEPDVLNDNAVILKLPELNVPAVIVTLLVVVSALPKVHPPPTPLNVSGVPVRVFPLVVIVLPVAVDENVTTPVTDQVTPVAARVKLPAIVDVPVPEKVTFPVNGPDAVKSAQVAPVATVTV